MTYHRVHTQGFTVFELLIVIGLMTIMLGIALVSLNAVRQKSRDGERVAVISGIALALEEYYSQCGSYPKSIDPADYLQGPCPLRSTDPFFFAGPTVLEMDATFASSNLFRLEQFGDTDFFYVPLSVTTVDDVCDAYHLGAVLERTDAVLETDSDFDSDVLTMQIAGVPAEKCFGADDGFDGDDADNVYDILR